VTFFLSLFGWLEKCKDQSHTLSTMIFLMVNFHFFNFVIWGKKVFFFQCKTCH
jgi:hypothetical protein